MSTTVKEIKQILGEPEQVTEGIMEKVMLKGRMKMRALANLWKYELVDMVKSGVVRSALGSVQGEEDGIDSEEGYVLQVSAANVASPKVMTISFDFSKWARTEKMTIGVTNEETDSGKDVVIRANMTLDATVGAVLKALDGEMAFIEK